MKAYNIHIMLVSIDELTVKLFLFDSMYNIFHHFRKAFDHRVYNFPKINKKLEPRIFSIYKEYYNIVSGGQKFCKARSEIVDLIKN